MFNKVLIANRGEIACRIIRTLNKMNIKSVVVYSDADANSLHVKLADEAVYVGHSPANESYLDIEKIVEAVIKTGADAVHPGYGFLSENAALATSLEKAGVTFIGPSVDSIKSMGDKIEAKQIAKLAGVNTIPGNMDIIDNEKDAKKIAKKIGFPVMIKAAAGGGGKGMRVVYSDKEVSQAFASATNEAKNSFSDGRIFIEKYIEEPRHIEIQLLSDQHGNIVCLGERECSIQRHHQKVIEEAPSVFIDDKTRKTMYRQVSSLAKRVKYFSAGTVEFIVDKNRNFYFLEMNTRLQVEHCVTELVTGIDIVEQMIRVANKEKLPFEQKDIELKGWAMEARIYAEDPLRAFLPSSGRLNEYTEPQTNDNVRVDSGVFEGAEISMFYDPMIAKLCTYGKDRNEAIELMKGALGNYVIRGVSHNISFLEAIITNERFVEGNISTNFVADEYPDGFTGSELTSQRGEVLLAAAILIYLKDARRASRITEQLPNRERQIGTKWIVSLDNEKFAVDVKPCSDGFNISLDSKRLTIRSQWKLGNTLLQATVNNKSVSVKLEPFAGGYNLTHEGRTIKARVYSPRVAELSKFMPEVDNQASDTALVAPISGKVVSIKVNVGETIKPGQDLLILEAMKMENVIKADKEVVISEIPVSEGDNVNVDQLLLEFAKAG